MNNPSLHNDGLLSGLITCLSCLPTLYWALAEQSAIVPPDHKLSARAAVRFIKVASLGKFGYFYSFEPYENVWGVPCQGPPMLSLPLHSSIPSAATLSIFFIHASCVFACITISPINIFLLALMSPFYNTYAFYKMLKASKGRARPSLRIALWRLRRLWTQMWLDL